MSANNLVKCPRCKANRIKTAQESEAKVQEAYGTVGLEEFNQLRAIADAQALAVDASGLETFREDYEIYGADEGEVRVRYSGRCTRCGLELNFTHRHPLDLT